MLTPLLKSIKNNISNKANPLKEEIALLKELCLVEENLVLSSEDLCSINAQKVVTKRTLAAPIKRCPCCGK